MTNVAWLNFSFLCTTWIILMNFYVHFRHADVPKDAGYLSCIVWDCVRVVKLRSKIAFYILLRILPAWFFCSLVTMFDLWTQYPDAGPIINCLLSGSSGCFKPEAHLLIKKYLSLEKENTRGFIANVQQNTTDRLKVSSIFSSGEHSSTLNQSSIISLGLLLRVKSSCKCPSSKQAVLPGTYALNFSRYKIQNMCCRTRYSSEVDEWGTNVVYIGSKRGAPRSCDTRVPAQIIHSFSSRSQMLCFPFRIAFIKFNFFYPPHPHLESSAHCLRGLLDDTRVHGMGYINDGNFTSRYNYSDQWAEVGLQPQLTPGRLGRYRIHGSCLCRIMDSKFLVFCSVASAPNAVGMFNWLDLSCSANEISAI